ncbi:primosomal protein N' [uncultured Helicobacter sp.]|uniref:primosomal protein N' n=1 Tax=uncultured Helicobacter sp. TaxID=175537 RepID=UPI00262F3206|nr:primosomal protein N' [uncultured Helicobacter sp.]
MFYYLIAPLALKTPPLAYQCEVECEIYDICAIEVRNKAYLGIVISTLDKPTFTCKSTHKSDKYFLSFQKILASFIAQYYCVSVGESFGLFVPQKMQEPHLECIQVPLLHTLNAEQEGALAFCQTHKNPLLFGDTGSGKTEIYIHLIAQTLQKAQSALFLMPEIALTPQIESRLKAVFGDMVGIWHSKVTQKQKKQILQGLYEGSIRVIAGARSALFLPIASLGLIIIDEEHDDAYKSQSSPRYNARDIALYLGQKSDVRVILGSATPSAASYYHALKHKSMCRLKGRYFGSSKHIKILPPPSALNAINSTQNRINEILGEEIITKMATSLSQKQQVIVFLPTRAHYKMLVCSACGSGCECEFCSVNMSLHLDKNALVCHYCHFCKPIPTLCPQCQRDTLHTYRIGTAQVAQILSEALPQARIALFDRDNITTHKKLKSVLGAFNKGEIDVLVGTQMLSKGHDYHRVNLAIVLGIDYILKSNDYRCNERAISLLHQIAGRSGRKDNGEVYIQSANGAFLQPFMEDYEDFLRYELETRPPIYPPHQRLATLTFSHKKEQIALKCLERVHNFLYQIKPKEVEIVGESRALLGRLYDKYRFVLLLRSYSTNALLKVLHTLQSNEKVCGSCEIDIDPLSIV